ncbi:MAG: Mu-like prophage major head subunit gpT family protein [Thermoguttaceae bacterium]|nr:Mu-like prophage major head subunit gpT family protein [Thermoguttaceae bacterium]
MKFEKVPRGSRLKHGTVSDEKYEVKAGTYGIMFALEREDLRNDDLGALTRIPQRIGMGAADAVNEACWELFLNPPKTKDGKDFYSTANKNLLTGAKSALSLDAISEARKQFAKMTRKGGAPIGVRPSILLVPPELEDKALMLTKATQFVGGADGTLSPSNYNPQVGRFKVVSSSYLSAEGWTGASEKAWFLLTDPNRLAAFEVAFLDGKDQPTVEQADADFDTLGVQFRGYVDFGVAAQDFRGVVKSTGEA